MPLPEIVLASRNRKKIGEMAEQLAPLGITLLGAADFPDLPEVVEDGETFAANAAKKARETALHTGRWAIGEDSGLCVDELQGAPGVYSARFSDPGATDERNNAKLQQLLTGVPPERRGAHYVCHVALANPQGEVVLAIEDVCRGRLTTEPRGTNGFGYDPYFEVREYHRTFGELSAAVKRRISHRARAFARFIPQMVARLS